MAAAVICYAKAIIPNLKSVGNIQKQYPVFYGDIKALTIKEYQELMENGTDEDFADELVLESWQNSRICLKTGKEWALLGQNCFTFPTTWNSIELDFLFPVVLVMLLNVTVQSGLAEKSLEI